MKCVMARHMYCLEERTGSYITMDTPTTAPTIVATKVIGFAIFKVSLLKNLSFSLHICILDTFLGCSTTIITNSSGKTILKEPCPHNRHVYIFLDLIDLVNHKILNKTLQFDSQMKNVVNRNKKANARVERVKNVLKLIHKLSLL
jgi:hypothetical protein